MPQSCPKCALSPGAPPPPAVTTKPRLCQAFALLHISVFKQNRCAEVSQNGPKQIYLTTMSFFGLCRISGYS